MTKFKLQIQRFHPEKDEAPQHETYEIQSEGLLNVMQAIRCINQTLDGTLSFRNSDCHRGVCGLCSMMINGKRRLACMCVTEDNMTIEPPSNRKIVKDLLYEIE
jgi:succinate dehydrogenase/fumarate reductase iron-sulfur protein